MRRKSRWLLPVVALFISSGWILAFGQNGAPSPTPQNRALMATRLFTGPDGQSHIDQVPIALQGTPVEESATLKMSDALRRARRAWDVRDGAQRRPEAIHRGGERGKPR